MRKHGFLILIRTLIAGLLFLSAYDICQASSSKESGIKQVRLVTGYRFTGYRFGERAPRGWRMDGNWSGSPVGAKAIGSCTATGDIRVPESCITEMVFELSAESATATMSMGAGKLTGSVIFDQGNCRAVLSGVGRDGKPVSVETPIDMNTNTVSPGTKAPPSNTWTSMLRSGQDVCLGIAISPGRTRLLVNGSLAAELTLGPVSDRELSVTGDGIVLKSVRVLPDIPEKMVPVSGAGMGLLCGGLRMVPTEVPTGENMETSVIDIHGVRMMVQSGGSGSIAVLDAGMEKYKSEAWSEGTGILTAPVPTRPYSMAHVLIYCEAEPGESLAMGFGLRVHERSTGDLRNIYVGRTSSRSSDDGVSVEPVPELGHGWYLAKVVLNPVELQWYTHDASNTLLPLSDPNIAERPPFVPSSSNEISLIYVGRTWSMHGGIPVPTGQKSACRVAAITLREAEIDVSVQGNGLGNVFIQPDKAHLTATIRNQSSSPLDVRISLELIPFGRTPVSKRLKVRIGAGQAKSFDALAASVNELGHYRVRVTADSGKTGRIDYRTNLALMPTPAKKENDMRFGCWRKLWGDESTDKQYDYLKSVAGVGFIMGKHNQEIRVGTPVPDDATAEKIASSIGPDVRVFMLGWEEGLSNTALTFAFPRVISEGKSEKLTDEYKAEMDKIAEAWLRLARAIRKLRPDVKLSLGNSGVNFTAGFLERGFKYGVDFDYFGTENGLFSMTPEEPTDAIGNVCWWARAICQYYGYPKVPLFHSETVYYATGPGFSRMDERTQAGNYVREFALGFPYDAVFGLSGAMVDSSNRYIYSRWGTPGYCNQAPECSPKLSFVTYATFTRMLNGAKYIGKLDTGSTSIYTLHLLQTDGSPVYVIWNLRGTRSITVKMALDKPVRVTDSIGRSVEPTRHGTDLTLEISDLPLYVQGCEIMSITPGDGVVDALPRRKRLSRMDDPADWTVDTTPDNAFEAPEEWRGVPKVMGKFDIARASLPGPLASKNTRALAFSLTPLAGKHGLIPRYVSMRAKAGREIPIPAGTTRLGLWMHGNSTWANVRFGVTDGKGRSMLLPKGDLPFQMTDNFDGWRFVQTGFLNWEVTCGGWKIDRMIITMPEQQVYVDDLITTSNPTVYISSLCSIQTSAPNITYLPW